MNLLKYVLYYASKGIPVIPVYSINQQGQCTCNRPDCNAPGKHPIINQWQKFATTDSQQIISWWTANPDANIGIPTGKISGWYVVDIDKKHGGIENYTNFIKQHPGIKNASIIANTGGGGNHLIYSAPLSGNMVKSKVNIGGLKGVDFRGDGGYIVAPPSLHSSMNRYTWFKGFSFDE